MAFAQVRDWCGSDWDGRAEVADRPAADIDQSELAPLKIL